MGLGMALNLQKHLQSKGLRQLYYSNRNLSKGQPLQNEGAVPENDFESLVRKSDIIFTMVWDSFLVFLIVYR
jgi:3-hydroxyisobutyrate dehydrogenase-like beta-hydroxyacid dehydrogenase